MRQTTDGLIIRETNVGEADKFVTILTRDRGIIRAAARGSRRVNSRSAAATQLLTHTQLSLQEGKSGWYIDDARPLTVFFGLHEDLEKLALAQYFCELAGAVCPREEPAEEALRLLLNALHFLAADRRPPLLLKALVECRLLAAAGYAPDLSGCCHCGGQERLHFLPAEGRLICDTCQSGRSALLISDKVLTAMRCFVNGTIEQSFSITLDPPQQTMLAMVTEAFLKEQLGRKFATLEFFNTLHYDT